MITRFAPSPTGFLHLGHALSAHRVWDTAREAGGAVILRIEDIDSERCRPVYETAIFDDLHWLGLEWPADVRRQSDHIDDYMAVLETLADRGLIYPCSCSRSQIAAKDAKLGWDGLVYPGTCRNRPMEDRKPGDALRLNLGRVIDEVGTLPTFTETGPLYAGDHQPNGDELLREIGDPVLKRKGTDDVAYHLACTHDDALQNVTHVIRGADLWRATFLHVVIQALMGWRTPTYHHHDLIRDEDGERLAKIDGSRAIATYRDAGQSPADIWRMIGF